MISRMLPAMALLLCWTAHGQDATNEPPGREHSIPLFIGHGDPESRQGFIRIINHSDEAGTVEIVGYDDDGTRWPATGAVTLSIGARETKHLNSGDLESGSTRKGLAGELGNGQGDWRLVLTGGGLDIEPLAYIRTGEGFLTSMNDVVPEALRNHRVPIFNPASNTSQRSWLRLINPGDVEAQVTVAGRDDAELPDAGDDPVTTTPGPFSLTIPPRGAEVLTAADLEDESLGGIGDGTGKWSLDVGSDVPIQVLNLMSTGIGYLSNLSAANPDYRGATGLWQISFEDDEGGDGYLILLPDSRMYAWLPEANDVDRVARGTFQTTAAGIEAGGELYESGEVEIQGLTPVGGKEDFTMKASYRSGDWIEGDYTTEAGTVRAFRGWAFTGFQRGSATSAVAGLWAPVLGDDADLSGSFEPTADGELEFQFAAGTFTCTVNGDVGPVNPAFSVYEADVIITCSLLVLPASIVDLILVVFDSPDRPGGGNYALVLAIVHNESKIGFGSVFRRDEAL